MVLWPTKIREVASLFRKNKVPTVVGGRIDNVLGPNTSYNGTIKSDGNIRIDGIYQGHVETAGNVIVGPSARVLANIVADAVQVWGAVRGDITAQGRLEILPDGHVWGDIRVGSLFIDQGGMFRGQCTMGEENLEPLMPSEPPGEETPQDAVREEADESGGAPTLAGETEQKA